MVISFHYCFFFITETETSETEEEQFDSDAVDSSILEITVKVLVHQSISLSSWVW